MESDILLTEKMHFTNLPGLSSWDAPAPSLPISLLMPGCELDFFFTNNCNPSFLSSQYIVLQ